MPRAGARTAIGVKFFDAAIPALLGFLYLSELQGLLAASAPVADVASLVLIHLADASNPTADQHRLAAAFPVLSVFTIGNILGAVQSAVDLYRTFGTIIGVIGLVVATLFASTVLLMSVDDRSREIALLRAVGFSRARVGWFAVQEGLLLSAIGLGVGLVLGYLGALALDGFLRRLLGGLPEGFSFISFQGSVVAAGILEVLLIGLAASIGPALQAVRLPVAEEPRAP